MKIFSVLFALLLSSVSYSSLSPEIPTPEVGIVMANWNVDEAQAKEYVDTVLEAQATLFEKESSRSSEDKSIAATDHFNLNRYGTHLLAKEKGGGEKQVWVDRAIEAFEKDYVLKLSKTDRARYEEASRAVALAGQKLIQQASARSGEPKVATAPVQMDSANKKSLREALKERSPAAAFGFSNAIPSKKGDLIFAFGSHSLEMVHLSQENVKGKKVWLLTYTAENLVPTLRARRVVPNGWVKKFKAEMQKTLNTTSRGLAAESKACSGRILLNEVNSTSWETKEFCLDRSTKSMQKQVSKLISKAQAAAGVQK